MEAVSMDLYPVMPEIMAERITGAIPIRAGELLAARVLHIEGEMLQLMLESGAVLKTRLLADLTLQKGEELVLQVKGVRDGSIEMSVAYRKQSAVEKPENNTGEYGARKSTGEMSIIEKLVENRLPVTPESIKEVQRALKQIYFLRDNFTRTAKTLPTECTIDVPIDKIVRWLAGRKNTAAGQTAAEGEAATAEEAKVGRDTEELEKSYLLMEELTEVEAEDVIKLKKFGLRLSLQNLVLSKNLRENKGFPGILLKTFFDKAGIEKEAQFTKKETIKTTPESESKGTEKALKDGGSDQVLYRRAQKAEPVDIKVLLKKVIWDEKALPSQRVAAELLEQRAFLLDQALSGQDLCIFPFMFDGRVFECLVKGGKQKGSSGQRQDVLELAVDTNPPGLGRIRVLIRVSGRDTEFGFFVDKEDTKSLIDRQRNTLREDIEKLGFRVNRITCGRMQERKPETADVFLDVKV
jgi:hypothetical protein